MGARTAIPTKVMSKLRQGTAGQKCRRTDLNVLPPDWRIRPWDPGAEWWPS
jgi:hypothetical protein